MGLLATAAMHLTGFTPSFSNSYSKMNRAVSSTGLGPRSSPSSTTTGGGVGDVSGVDSGPWRATGNDTSDKMGNSKYGRTMRQLNADKIVKCGDFKILNMTLCEEPDCDRVTNTNVVENNFPNEEHYGSTSGHDRFLYLETTKGVYIYYPDMIEQNSHNTRTVSNGYTKTSLHNASDSSSGPIFRDSRPICMESVRNDNKWNEGMMGSEYKNGTACEEQEDRDNVDEEDENKGRGKEEREGEREESAGEVEGEDGGNWRDRESESDEEEGEEGEDEDEEGDTFGTIHDKDKFFRKSSHDRMNDMLSSRRFQQMPLKDRKVTSKDKRNSDNEISAPTPGSLIKLLTHTLDGISVGKSVFPIIRCCFLCSDPLNPALCGTVRISHRIDLRRSSNSQSPNEQLNIILTNFSKHPNQSLPCIRAVSLYTLNLSSLSVPPIRSSISLSIRPIIRGVEISLLIV